MSDGVGVHFVRISILKRRFYCDRREIGCAALFCRWYFATEVVLPDQIKQKDFVYISIKKSFMWYESIDVSSSNNKILKVNSSNNKMLKTVKQFSQLKQLY